MSGRFARLAMLLAAAAAGLLGFGLLSRDHVSQRGLEYMPDMAHSLAYDAFAANPVTRDGKTLQAPVAGTIPRGFTPFHYAAGTEEAERAGRELMDPLPATPKNLAHGKALFQTFCLVCHGESGKGDGPLVPKIPNPPSYSSERVRAFPPGRIYHVITLGTGNMPSYASQVSPEERWLIVRYVQTLQALEGTP
ncbi:MAG TPA: cytochrome c [Methylomirabilota bacterium]|nr:cytochrome c [Methylomirabilota bacterium]